MKKTHRSHKSSAPDQSRRHKLQLQVQQVRRRRLFTAGFGGLVLLALLLLEYYRDVPAWLWLILWVIPFFMVLDTLYLKYLRQQISSHG